MADLVSPGVSITVEDNSFFVPAALGTTALFFIATAAEKLQSNGLVAEGTYEHEVIRTVTSVRQSSELYGAPNFIKSPDGKMHHGDARNEYGLLALNNYLGVSDLAFVIRANVNLDDTITNVREIWDTKIEEAGYILGNLVNQYLNETNSLAGYVPVDLEYRTTINNTEYESLANIALAHVWEFSSFANSKLDFFPNKTTSAIDVFADGYDAIKTGEFIGLTGMMLEWVQNASGTVNSTEWTSYEATQMLIQAGDLFKYTREFNNKTSLGVNDAARRATIVTALRKAIASNQDIRSESYEYSLIVCPGYHEVVPDLIGLAEDIEEEAFVIGDVPMDLNPDEAALWATTTARANSRLVAYYYPHTVVTNALTGEQVLAPASVSAVRTYAYSDNVSEVWIAPAGTQRGLLSNVSYVGYVSGELGTPTTIVEVALNRGQRSNLYKYYTNINPIVYYPSRGIVIMGQKTSSPDASALDRVNVVRLLCYIRRQLRTSLLPFLFRPNDQRTRDDVKALVDNFLSGILARRGLYDFATQCDESNNPPSAIDRSELHVSIALAAMKMVEFIYVPIRVVNTGAVR